MKNIKEIKKELGITDKEIAEFFGYKTTKAYSSTTAKARIEKGIEQIYNNIKNKEMKKSTAELLIEKKREFQSRIYTKEKMNNPNYTYGGQDDNGNFVYLWNSPLSGISEKPLNVFGLWNDGKDIKEIGSLLGISIETIYRYVEKLVSVFCNKQTIIFNNEKANKYLKEVREQMLHLGLLEE